MTLIACQLMFTYIDSTKPRTVSYFSFCAISSQEYVVYILLLKPRVYKQHIVYILLVFKQQLLLKHTLTHTHTLARKHTQVLSIFIIYHSDTYLHIRAHLAFTFIVSPDNKHILANISVATGGGGVTGGNCPPPPPTVIRSTPEIRANPRSLGGGGGEGDNRKAESNESNKNHRQLQL